MQAIADREERRGSGDSRRKERESESEDISKFSVPLLLIPLPHSFPLSTCAQRMLGALLQGVCAQSRAIL